MLEEWKRRSDGQQTMEQRGILKITEEDQEALVSVRDCESEKDIVNLMHHCCPWFDANWYAIDALSSVTSKEELQTLVQTTEKDPKVTSRVRRLITKNARKLKGVLD